jgi:hypothetical protein
LLISSRHLNSKNGWPLIAQGAVWLKQAQKQAKHWTVGRRSAAHVCFH